MLGDALMLRIAGRVDVCTASAKPATATRCSSLFQRQFIHFFVLFLFNPKRFFSSGPQVSTYLYVIQKD